MRRPRRLCWARARNEPGEWRKMARLGKPGECVDFLKDQNGWNFWDKNGDDLEIHLRWVLWKRLRISKELGLLGLRGLLESVCGLRLLKCKIWAVHQENIGIPVRILLVWVGSCLLTGEFHDGLR